MVKSLSHDVLHPIKLSLFKYPLSQECIKFSLFLCYLTFNFLFFLITQVHLNHAWFYCVQAWSHYKKKHIDLIEGVQKRAIRLVPELRNMSYEKQLEELNLTELVDRRLRGDMIETFKIITGEENLNPQHQG